MAGVVALRKESVDRNQGADIEHKMRSVALRKESVDRNSTKLANSKACITSLSARRAWIEMLVSVFTNFLPAVALRKESVDRNHFGLFFGCYAAGRSPQGERG